jgi:glycosyltransferase involved in cell wall biosynthesis
MTAPTLWKTRCKFKTMLNHNRRRLRIAQVAPLYESVPPNLYGGTERVVAYLTEELVHRGHQVTLFAAGDSSTAATLKATHPKSLRATGMVSWGNGLHLPMLSEVFDHADRFDVIHCHLDYWSFPFARMVKTPSVTTLHGRLDIPELLDVYRYYSGAFVVSISNAQRAPLRELNWVGTVHHGLPADQLTFQPDRGKYLAFLGRIAPEKRPDLAIEIARRAGIPLKIAAKFDAVDQEYFDSKIRPLLKTDDVEFIGEIGEREKNEFLGNATALLFPIDWPEPFGLVMIEALACGTPVIARPCGSVPEVLRHGVTGLVASDIDGLVQAVQAVSSLSRQRCRAEFEARFTAGVMAENYEQIYSQLIDDSRTARHSDGRSPRRGAEEEAVIEDERSQHWRSDLENA